MKGSYFQLFLKGCSFSVVALGCMGVLNYLIRRYQVFHLSEYEYGLFYSILALVSLTGSFAEFGLTQAGTVLIAEASLQPERKERLSSCFSGLLGFKFTTSMVLFLILLVFNVPIREHYLKGVPFLFYLTGIALLLAQMADSAFKALWNGTKNYFLQNAISIVQAALLFGLVLCLTDRYSVQGSLLAFLAAPVLISSSALLAARKKLGIRLRLPERGGLKRLLCLSGLVGIGTTLLNMTYQLNVALLTLLKGVEASADYNIALPIMQIMQLSMVIPFIFLPIAVQMVREKEYKAIGRYQLSATLVTLGAVPVAFLVFREISPFLVRLLFSGKYEFVAPTVTVLCSGQLLFTYGSFLMQIMIAMDGARVTAVIAAVTFLINVILNFLLIGQFGIQGAAWSTFFAYLFFAAAMNRMLRLRIRKEQRNPMEMSAGS